VRRAQRLGGLLDFYHRAAVEQGGGSSFQTHGHASIQVTVDIYGHLVPGGNRAAVDRLDATICNPGATDTLLMVAVSGAKSLVENGEPRRNGTLQPAD
jgi:hypothetical protein